MIKYLVLAATLAVSCLTAHEAISKIAVRDGIARIYQINSGSGNCVTNHSPNIVSEPCDPAAKRQQWVIYPVLGEKAFKSEKTTNGVHNRVLRYRIQSVKDGAYLAINPTGNAISHGFLDDESQIFSFINYTRSVDDFNIGMKSSGSEEVVLAEKNWNIFRWGLIQGDSSQRFSLTAVKEWPKPAVKASQASPGSLKRPAPPTSTDESGANKTAQVLIGEEVLPFEWVDDAERDKLNQILNTPYYILAREQYFSRKINRFIRAHETETVSDNVRKGFSNEHMRSMEQTVGVTLSAEWSASVGGKVGDETAGVEARQSTKLAAQYVNQSKTTEVTTQSESRQEESSVVNRFTPSGQDCRLNLWVLVDKYSLYRVYSDGLREVVKMWESNDSSNVDVRTYPENCASTKKS